MRIPLGNVTLISGYRGLAETLIATFHRAGHRLSVLVRQKEALPGLLSKYPDHLFFTGDLSNTSTARDWVEHTLCRFGKIDLLINNAAVNGPAGKLHDIAFEEFEDAVRINLLSPIYLTQEVIKHFIHARSGVVINLSGGGAGYGRPHFGAYAISKCALVRMTECLAGEYPALRFYAISPGGLKTPMMEKIYSYGPEKIGKEHEAAKRILEGGGEDPKKAADLALWLFENRPAMLSGQLISAVWDDYKNAPEHPDKIGWWRLRRIDELCRKNLKSV